MPESAPVQPSVSTTPGVAHDVVGEKTLELFEKNAAYSEFIWEALLGLSPDAVRGRVLEVGCGIGNLTRIVLRRPDVTLLHSIDLDPAYIERVRGTLDDARLRLTTIAAEEFCPPEYSGDADGFDCIFSSNVLEHIEDDGRVLRNFRAMLKPGGVVLVLVPAHEFLFSGLDRNLSHFRRYTRKSLSERARSAGLEALRVRYFNPIGAAGWWLNGKVLGRQTLPAGQLSFYSRFGISLSRWVDRCNPLPLGVSVLAALGRAD